MNRHLSKLPIIEIVIILLGAMLLNEFYKQLALGNLTIPGFSTTLKELATSDFAPQWWKQMMFWIADHSLFFAPFIGPLLAGSAICLLLLLVRGAITLIAAMIYLVYWISLWGYPGIWIFEFLFPFLFAFSAALATLPLLLDGPTDRHRLLGTKLFGNLKLRWRLLIVLLSSVGIWYVIILSKNAREWNTLVAWQTAVSFAILFSISAFLDKYRCFPEDRATHPSKLSKRLNAISWVDVMVLCIAAMMVMQVYADQAIGFYAKETYAALIRSYAETTSAPDWFKAFLSWSADHAAILMPLQAIFEAVIAILLSLLVLRGPVLLLTTSMFIVFTYAEFGVSGTFPPRPGASLTQTWELLFVTCVAFFIGVKQTACLIQASSWREKLLGEPLFGHLRIKWFIIAILAGAALFFAGNQKVCCIL